MDVKDIEQKVCGSVADTYRVAPDTVTRDTVINELSDKSIMRVALNGMVEDEFNIVMPIRESMAFRTVGEYVDYVVAHV